MYHKISPNTATEIMGIHLLYPRASTTLYSRPCTVYHPLLYLLLYLTNRVNHGRKTSTYYTPTDAQPKQHCKKLLRIYRDQSDIWYRIHFTFMIVTVNSSSCGFTVSTIDAQKTLMKAIATTFYSECGEEQIVCCLAGIGSIPLLSCQF